MKPIKLTLYGSDGNTIFINPKQIIAFHLKNEQDKVQGSRIYTPENDQPFSVEETPELIEDLLQQAGGEPQPMRLTSEGEAPGKQPEFVKFLHTINEIIPNRRHSLTMDESGRLIARVFAGSLVQDFYLDENEINDNPNLAIELANEVKKRMAEIETAQPLSEDKPQVREMESEDAVIKAAAGLKAAIKDLIQGGDVLLTIIQNDGIYNHRKPFWINRTTDAIRKGECAMREFDRAIKLEAENKIKENECYDERMNECVLNTIKYHSVSGQNKIAIENEYRIKTALEYAESALVVNSFQGYAGNPRDDLLKIAVILKGGSWPTQKRMEEIIEAANDMRTCIQNFLTITKRWMNNAGDITWTIWEQQVQQFETEAKKSIMRYNEMTNSGNPGNEK